MRTVFEHCLVILRLDLVRTHVRRRRVLARKLSYLGRCVVIHGKRDSLARDVKYPYVVEDLRIVEWDFSGDW